MTSHENTNGIEDDYISTKEAAAIVGKGKDAMTNWVKKFAYDAGDPRRRHLKPTFEQVAEFKEQGRTWAWKLHRSMVLREFGLLSDDQENSRSGAGDRKEEEDKEYVRIRMVDLEFIKDQNRNLSEQNSQLSERLKEANILRSVEQLSRGDLTPEARESLNLLLTGYTNDLKTTVKSAPKSTKDTHPSESSNDFVEAEFVRKDNAEKGTDSKVVEDNPVSSRHSEQRKTWLERNIPSVFARH